MTKTIVEYFSPKTNKCQLYQILPDILDREEGSDKKC